MSYFADLYNELYGGIEEFVVVIADGTKFKTPKDDRGFHRTEQSIRDAMNYIRDNDLERGLRFERKNK